MDIIVNYQQIFDQTIEIIKTIIIWYAGRNIVRGREIMGWGGGSFQQVCLQVCLQICFQIWEII
jgi:hypothetical protein